MIAPGIPRRHLVDVQPDHIIVQSYQPVGYRANLAGVLASPAVTCGNIGKT